MRVMEIVRLAGDRFNDGPEGKVVAVGGRRNARVTVKWDDGKMTEPQPRGTQARLQPIQQRAGLSRDVQAKEKV